MKKPQKQLLSVLFHLAVLGCMVMTYDAGKAIAKKLGWIKSEDVIGGTDIDLMAKEEQLSTEIDPALAKLVGRDGEAFLFRRDIPYPPHLKVVSSKVTKLNKVRMAGKSDFGEGSMVLSIRNDEVMEYEMAGKAVRFTMKEMVSEKIPSQAERIARLKEIEEAVKKGEKPPEARERIVDDLVGKAVQFNYDGRAWKAIPTKEFKTMAWAKGLEEQVGATLVENGLRPRPRWFGAEPMKAGTVTKLSSNSLDLVFDGYSGGSVEMKLKGLEGVHGHPCAVFEVSGSLVMAKEENDRGQITGGEATVEKGRIWCSLLYPIVLRGDLDLIVSIETREGAKLVNQMQGSMRETFHRDWKAVKAKPQKAPSEK
jgi:hypothetical protein